MTPSTSSTNRPRGVPGLILLVFAMAMTWVAVARWMQHATSQKSASPPAHSAAQAAPAN